MYYLYMLRCQGHVLYTGITTDPARRLEQHRGNRKGGAKYTAAHTPEGFAAVWAIGSMGEALRLESRIKRLRREQKELLIAGYPAGELDMNVYTRWTEEDR